MTKIVLRRMTLSNRHQTDSFVFYLHYRLTFLLLITAGIVVTYREFMGERIECMSNPQYRISQSLLEIYCWTSSAYSFSSSNFKEIGIGMPQPGISGSKDGKGYLFRDYYQYVHLLLFIQAMIFYVPHIIWKYLSGKRLDLLCDIIDESILEHKVKLAIKEKGKSENKGKIENKGKTENKGKIKNKRKKEDKNVKKGKKTSTYIYEDAVLYIATCWNQNATYAWKYVSCELLCFANVIIQMLLLDTFFDGRFLKLGMYLIDQATSLQEQDVESLFPIKIDCLFKNIDDTAKIDVIDTWCVLPGNILKTKIYQFFWMWFVMLLTMSFFNLSHLLLSAISARYRALVLILGNGLITKGARDRSEYFQLVTNYGKFGDWFMLRCVNQNVEKLEFDILMKDVRHKLDLINDNRDENFVGCPSLVI